MIFFDQEMVRNGWQRNESQVNKSGAKMSMNTSKIDTADHGSNDQCYFEEMTVTI